MRNESIVLEEPGGASGKALTEWQNHRPSPYLLEPSSEKQDDEFELDLLDYWRILVKHKWTVFICLFITLVTVITATFLITPIYRSTLTLQIESEPAKIVKYEVESETNAYQSYDSFYKRSKSVV